MDPFFIGGMLSRSSLVLRDSALFAGRVPEIWAVVTADAGIQHNVKQIQNQSGTALQVGSAPVAGRGPGLLRFCACLDFLGNVETKGKCNVHIVRDLRLMESQKSLFSVIPAKAGIQKWL